MGNSPSAKQKVPIAQQVYDTASRIGSFLTKPKDDPTFLWDREIQPLENFFLVWLDSTVERNEQIQMTMKHFEKVIMNTRLMDDCDVFKECLKEYKADEKIVIIVSGEFVKKIVPDIHDVTSIIAIYVYSLDYTIDDKWIQKYWKMRGVASGVNELLRQLLTDLTYIKRMEDLNNQSILDKPPVDNPSISEMKKKLNQRVIQTARLTTLFVVVNLSTHLNQLASAMLDTLCSLTEDSILVLENTSAIDFGKRPQKTILFFVSSEFAAKMKNKPKQVTAVFILESDKNRVDQQERFVTGEDLICQLADEIYRCYMKEASEYLMLGDSLMAKTKLELADNIYSELMKVHEKYFVNNNTTEVSTVTTLVWLKSISHENTEVEKVKELFSKVVSSFLVFDIQYDCHKYLMEDEFTNAVFFIIDNDYEDSIVVDFQQLSNVKGIYRYGQSSSENETVFSNCFDLCSRLIYDLITHYNRLGTDCSATEDAKTARDMFMKAHELCNILAKI